MRLIVSVLAYLADAGILSTYAVMVRRGSVRPFHWANALGGAPLLGVEVLTHAWPVAPITATFFVLGWIGVLCA